jgi:RHS repeat-associated protein
MLLAKRYGLKNKGDSLCLTNEKGKSVSEYGYEAFGRVTEKEGSFKSNPYRFSTKEHGPDNLYYYGARYYDPQAGRWLTQDPLGMVDGPNTYAFIGNNPVNFVDPWGEQEAVLGGGLTTIINRLSSSQFMQQQGNKHSGVERSATGGEEGIGSGGDDPWWKKLWDWLKRLRDKSDQNRPQGKNIKWDSERQRWVDDNYVYTYDKRSHDKRGGGPHWDRGPQKGGPGEWSPDGTNWYPK